MADCDKTPLYAMLCAGVENDEFHSVFKQERSACRGRAICDVLGLRMLKLLFLQCFKTRRSKHKCLTFLHSCCIVVAVNHEHVKKERHNARAQNPGFGSPPTGFSEPPKTAMKIGPKKGNCDLEQLLQYVVTHPWMIISLSGEQGHRFSPPIILVAPPK